MYNGRSSIVMYIYRMIGLVFHMLISLQNHDNKFGLFLLSGVIVSMQAGMCHFELKL